MNNRSSFSRSLHWISRIKKKIIVSWLRFSQKHQDSRRLPFVLFGILILDGFVMVVPGIFFLVGSVTISPKRWTQFASIFTLAGTTNNIVAYCLGRVISPSTFVRIIEYFNIENLWHTAERALHHYGSYATFVGATIGLPTQLIMALIGITDSQLLRDDPTVSSSFLKSILFVFAGHAARAFVVAGLARFGWLKLEKKWGQGT